MTEWSTYAPGQLKLNIRWKTSVDKSVKFTALHHG
jgi:hypothetical protein